MLSKMIYKLRNSVKLSQEQFADLFGVTRQSVQKWENGTSVPEISKLIDISKYFGISLDALILDRDNRMVEELRYNKVMKPQYANMHDWESYTSAITTEYMQSTDEGLDIEMYKPIFDAVANLPKGEIKKRFGDILFDIVLNAGQKAGYKYIEPSELEQIKNLRVPHDVNGKIDKEAYEQKVHGAWLGRICGCMLGKTVEGIRTSELIPFLKESDNYPMHRYILRSDITDDVINKYTFSFPDRCYADEIDGMPIDDDTNYVVLAQILIEKYGHSFTPYDVSRIWLDYQGKNSYCTAERVAYCNFVNGYEPPHSATYKNPYREWIGAQIRGDYFGYISPGNPEKAAEMAWRDASISHIKNGVYGEMLVSAMISVAAITDDIEEIILAGLAQIPHTSRLYEDIMSVLNDYRENITFGECLGKIYKKYDECTSHGWCHTNSNAMIVVAALLYGNGDFEKSICLSVEAGFDTDCNGATVGSIIGMIIGCNNIPQKWKAPMNDTLHTGIFMNELLKISDRAKLTMKHVQY